MKEFIGYGWLECLINMNFKEYVFLRSGSYVQHLEVSVFGLKTLQRVEVKGV